MFYATEKSENDTWTLRRSSDEDWNFIKTNEK